MITVIDNFRKLLKTFKRLAEARLLMFAYFILSRMSGNPNFITPSPDLSVLTDVIEAYRLALDAAQTRERTKVLLKNQAKAQLIAVLDALVAYVEFTAQGDAAVLSSSGFDLNKLPEPRTISAPVLQLTDGENSGEFVSRAKGSRNASGFTHQYAMEPITEGTVWTSVQTTSRVYLITGLQKAKVYSCRVGAVGAKKQLVFSNPISRVAQ